LDATFDGRLVDPIPSDGLSEHVEGRLVLFDDDIGVVGVAAAGHRGVDATTIGRGGVDKDEGDVDGAALGGVAGLGIAELNVLDDVPPGEPDGTGPSAHGTLRSSLMAVMT
jgi:hypothetical protein